MTSRGNLGIVIPEEMHTKKTLRIIHKQIEFERILSLSNWNGMELECE